MKGNSNSKSISSIIKTNRFFYPDSSKNFTSLVPGLHYVRHPVSLFDFIDCPKDIYEMYRLIDYKLIYIEDYNEIPIPHFMLLSIDENFDLSELRMDQYAKGFLIGFNENLIPYIDTPENRIISLSNAIGTGLSGFKKHKGISVDKRYNPADFFQDGLREGRRYKAWGIILKDPNLFHNLFKDDSKPQKKRKLTEKKIAYNAFMLHISNRNKKTALTNVFNNLIDYSFIDVDSDIKDFRKIFNNELPFRSIKWTGTLEELCYFIKQLHLGKYINDTGVHKWAITHTLFVDEVGNQFNRSSLKGQHKPAKSKILDNIIYYLK